MEDNSRSHSDKVVLMDGGSFLQASFTINRFIDKVQEEFSVLVFVLKVLIAIICTKIVVIPNANHCAGLLEEPLVPWLRLGHLEPLHNVFFGHRTEILRIIDIGGIA